MSSEDKPGAVEVLMENCRLRDERIAELEAEIERLRAHAAVTEYRRGWWDALDRVGVYPAEAPDE